MIFAAAVGSFVGGVSFLLSASLVYLRGSAAGQYLEPAQIALTIFAMLCALFFIRLALNEMNVGRHAMSDALLTLHTGQAPQGRSNRPVLFFSVLFGPLLHLVGPEGFFIDLFRRIAARFSYRVGFIPGGLGALLPSVLAASFAVTFGYPFGAAILAWELRPAWDQRQRFAPFVAALSAFTVSSLAEGFFFQDSSLSDFIQTRSVFGGIAGNVRGLELLRSDWLRLSVAASALGFVIGILIVFTSRFSVWVYSRSLPAQKAHPKLSMLLVLSLISLLALLLPGYFSGLSGIWEDIGWQRLSGGGAFVMAMLVFAVTIAINVRFGAVGVFSPVVTIGALLGYFCGNWLQADWATLLAFCGATAALAACFGAPFAAVAFSFEIFRASSSAVFPLFAIAVAIAVVRLLKHQSLQEQILVADGHGMRANRLRDVLKEIQVSEAVARDCTVVRENDDFARLQTAIRQSRYGHLAVMGDSGDCRGVLGIERIPKKMRRALFDEGARNIFEVKELAL
jgi:H+/Cl- antiporter ClcA